MNVIDNKGNMISDHWLLIPNLTPIPSESSAIVSLERYLSEKTEIITKANSIGLIVEPDQALDDIANELNQFGIIVLLFPKFTDGRAYSHARLLRQHHNYSGEIRAAGNILRDQLFFMKRCGFDSFILPDDKATTDWISGFSDFSAGYQYSSDDLPIAACERWNTKTLMD
ncbi:MAG: DUF934 domain-containing protein [Rhodospirillaceae bacterium]